MVCASPDPVALPVIRTSTRLPGCTNPETELKSFTRTDTARIPGGIIEGKPEPPFSAASLVVKTKSPAEIA